MRRLMVIVPERISAWISKGEVIDRYYNPGDLFDEVHLVLLSDDRPDMAAIHRMVGRAHVEVHNEPTGPDLFIRTLGWRPALLRYWAQRFVVLAERIQPSVVRCYGVHLNAFAALEIKRRLGIPFVVSVHVNPDEDLRGRATSLRQRTTVKASISLERAALRGADLVLPVYRPILPYLERMGASRVDVAYNMLNTDHVVPKRDYGLSGPPRLVSVGRQFPAKNPASILRAVAALPDVRLDLIGHGELHDGLVSLAGSLGIADRVQFVRTVPNDALLERLATYDLFVVHTEFWELSKSVLEALLAGLPVVMNQRSGEPVPELADGLVRFVDDTPESYAAAISRLLTNAAEREELGTRGRAVAEARWDRRVTEGRFVEHYLELMARAG